MKREFTSIRICTGKFLIIAILFALAD